MYALIIHDDAKDDLRALRLTDAGNIARLLVFLQELSRDAGLMDRLLDEGYEDEFIDVDAISRLRAFNLFRVKVRALDVFVGKPYDSQDSSRWLPYRVLYAPDHRWRRFYVLAVLKRDDDTYDPKSPRLQKLLQTHDRLGLPVYGHSH